MIVHLPERTRHISAQLQHGKFAVNKDLYILLAFLILITLNHANSEKIDKHL